MSLAARAALAGGGVVVLAGLAVALVFALGRPHLVVSSKGEALVTVHAGGLDSQVGQVRATSAGRPLPLRRAEGGFVPVDRLAQGEVVEVSAVVSPPSWLRWLLGGPVTSSTTVRAPAAAPAASVVIAQRAGEAPVRFDAPVSTVAYAQPGGVTHVVHLPRPASLVDLTVQGTVGGSLQVQAAPRPWERLSARASTLSWFSPPANDDPVALVEPAPGSVTASSDSPVSLTFDHAVSSVLGTSRPTLTPAVAGAWSQPAPNRLVFTPSGFGFGPGTSVTVHFDRPVAVAASTAATTTGVTTTAAVTTAATTTGVTTTAAVTTAATTTYSFQVAPGSLLRLAQLLAQLDYLPLRFVPSPGVALPVTVSQEVSSISAPLQGSFSWRWSTVPSTLAAQWTPATLNNVMVKGALMAFEANRPTSTYDGYTLDGESVSQMADASTWDALVAAAVAHHADPNPYSYVYVTKALPETLTLWENGADVLTALTNTGIPQDATADGTFPIYARFTVDYMNGTNPTGTPYHDLVHWINYFNGGDAVHGFVRASYGFPQSLGCVELPVATAQVAFAHLAIGDLVTVAG